LRRLELLAEREDFWGCHLMLVCQQAFDPAAQDQVVVDSRLRADLAHQIEEAASAIRKAAAGLATSRSTLDPANTGHSEDFREVRWYGKKYRFTKMQAKAVECLWYAWEKTWSVSKADLLKACGSEGSVVDDIFKKHPAWKTMIVSVGQGVYSLQAPTRG
jgi:hypothetical protein